MSRSEAEREGTEEATEESEQAFKKVADELDTAFSSVGNAFRDAEVKDDAKTAANSLLAAFGTTFQEIGDAVQRAMGRTESDLETETETEPVDEAAEEIRELLEEPDVEDDPPADV